MTNLTRRSLVLTTVAAALAVSIPSTILRAEAALPDVTRWVIEAEEARSLLADGALLFDTRSEALKEARPVPGAVFVIWQDFAQSAAPVKGRLLDDDAVLTGKLRGLGVSRDRAVVVIADSKQGWGEDGRIVWTLRTLGHEHAYLVNGGIDALLEAGDLELAPAGTGDFTVARTEDYEITKEDLVARLGASGLVILDTREAREYAGETPYGESRGGHVPGARHLFYRDLVGEDGRILDGDALKARLAALGVGEQTEVVSYCTGGVRAGFVTAVLNNAGVRARNYAGSMWEWSAAPAEEFPLVSN
jgi:thiosulfate/3-mercaptopyruvate sulfurtransferase